MSDKTRPPRKGPDLGNDDQVRRIRRSMERSATEVVRCQNCGHQQAAEAAFIGPRTTCEECSTPLHSCRHCVFFDPRVARQCKKNKRVSVGIGSANECDGFEARLVLDATGKRLHGKGSHDAKSAFDSLFK
jgi:hypothetical protein